MNSLEFWTVRATLLDALHLWFTRKKYLRLPRLESLK